jgi:cysteinyl-tRNA synthetase
LGETFDIHGGGLDLVFPHHENEIAQSEACHGRPMARYWMHNGLMQASSEVGKVGGRHTRAVEGDIQSQDAGKISKSRGSSPFREMLADFEPETIRFFLVSTHYRRPIDFSEERIREVGTGLATFYRFFKRYERIAGKSFYAITAPARRADGEFQPGGEAVLAEVAELRQRFLEAMDDDFNTGGAIGVLFDLLRRLNKLVDDEKMEEARPAQARLAVLERGARTLRELAGTLGLFRRPPKEAKPGADEDALVAKLMDLLIEVRADSRKAKNFAAADKIRQRLAQLGIVLEDRPGGTEWAKE